MAPRTLYRGTPESELRDFLIAAAGAGPVERYAVAFGAPRLVRIAVGDLLVVLFEHEATVVESDTGEPVGSA